MKQLLLVSIMALFTFSVSAETNSFSLKSLTPKKVKEQWTLSLGGAGSTATVGDFDSSFSTEISLGRTGHLLVPLEGGLRQSIAYDSRYWNEDSVWFGSRLYLDSTLLSYKGVDLFAGGNVGLSYGDNTSPQWEGGPEAGLRFWIKQDIAVIGRVEYPFDLDAGRGQDRLNYHLGLQIKF